MPNLSVKALLGDQSGIQLRKTMQVAGKKRLYTWHQTDTPENHLKCQHFPKKIVNSLALVFSTVSYSKQMTCCLEHSELFGKMFEYEMYFFNHFSANALMKSIIQQISKNRRFFLFQPFLFLGAF